jgi:hypothetical protein
MAVAWPLPGRHAAPSNAVGQAARAALQKAQQPGTASGTGVARERGNQ